MVGPGGGGKRPPTVASQGTMSEVIDIGRELVSEYKNCTPRRLKILDIFLGFIFLTGVVQFVYCALVGTFPFNSFLAGFMCTVGAFVLTVSLRFQAAESIAGQGARSLEKALADYILCNIILFLVVMNFMG